jgi:hypothetical protein
MSLFQGPVKRPPLRNTYGSRRPTKQQRQPDGSTSSTLVASVTAGATDPESLNPSRDRSAAAASASSVGNAAAATAKRPAARHEHGTPTSASVRTASGRQTPETSTRDDNDAAPPPRGNASKRPQRQVALMSSRGSASSSRTGPAQVGAAAAAAVRMRSTSRLARARKAMLRDRQAPRFQQLHAKGRRDRR